jgi:L-ascorbate metabolism protein UlaG (beta-lactamase superfamily)
MLTEFQAETFSGTLADDIVAFSGALAFWWLGQAGFAFRWHEKIFLIDPYLSDFLEQKYAGRQPSHRRMMERPLNIADLPRLDFVFITHRHGDHLDPVTIRRVQELFPEARVVLPAAETTFARGIGLNLSQAFFVKAAQELDFRDELLISVLPSAHEEIEQDENGNDRFLGFVFSFGDKRIYHSGDCVPYPGLGNAIRKAKPHVALLPVNGRDRARHSLGIPGNFTLEEAIGLCRNADVPTMVAHHYGMFAFNTIPEERIDRAVETSRNPRVWRAKVSMRYRLISQLELI